MLKWLCIGKIEFDFRKREIGMKRIFAFVVALFLTVATISAANAAPRHSIDFSGKKIITLAAIPYINVSGDESSYVLDSLKEGYTDYFAKEGFKIVPRENTLNALSLSDYIEGDNIIASDEVMRSVAENTKADFVIAMEVEEIAISREDEFPKTKLTAKIKLLYKIYDAAGSKIYPFRITTSRDNKATLAEVGPKYAVKNALNQALERGNHRLIEIINGKKNIRN